MVRKIIKIDEEKCDGCGLCVTACHEGAIGLADGKAKLLRDDYCDGLGDCLPACPTGAITFENREAAEYDEAAVKANKESSRPETLACGCPGTQSKPLGRVDEPDEPAAAARAQTRLNQWPVQIKLVPPSAPYFKNADLLIAADCAAFAYGDFHAAFMKDRITIIGCPKLDGVDYAEKLTAILQNNDIKSVTVVKMEVPCCSGLEHAAVAAIKNSGKFIPRQVITLTTDGKIIGG